jgi:hypothetical protein
MPSNKDGVEHKDSSLFISRPMLAFFLIGVAIRISAKGSLRLSPNRVMRVQHASQGCRAWHWARRCRRKSRCSWFSQRERHWTYCRHHSFQLSLSLLSLALPRREEYQVAVQLACQVSATPLPPSTSSGERGETRRGSAIRPPKPPIA